MDNTVPEDEFEPLSNNFVENSNDNEFDGSQNDFETSSSIHHDQFLDEEFNSKQSSSGKKVSSGKSLIPKKCNYTKCGKILTDEVKFRSKGLHYCSTLCVIKNCRSYVQSDIYKGISHGRSFTNGPTPKDDAETIKSRSSSYLFKKAKIFRGIVGNFSGYVFAPSNYAPVEYFKHALFKQFYRELTDPNKACFVNVNVQLPRIFPGSYMISNAIGYYLQVKKISKAGSFNHYYLPQDYQLSPLEPTLEVEFQLHNFNAVHPDQEWSTIGCNVEELVDEYRRDQASMKSYPVEFIHPNNPPFFIIGYVIAAYGDWLNVRCNHQSNCWFHPFHGFVRPCGWAEMVGCPMSGSREHITNNFADLFVDDKYRQLYLEWPHHEEHSECPFLLHQKLELLDPFSHSFEFATVYAILRYGFILIRTDITCKTLPFHWTSPYLYPAGYSQLHSIPVFNHDKEEIFWKDILDKDEDLIMFAPAKLFKQHRNMKTKNRFKPGQIVETFNVIGDSVIAYGCITRIVSRILFIYNFCHFEQSNISMVDFESPHIYPVGFNGMTRFQNELHGLKFMSLAHCKYGPQSQFIKQVFKIRHHLVEKEHRKIPPPKNPKGMLLPRSTVEQIYSVPDIPELSMVEKERKNFRLKKTNPTTKHFVEEYRQRVEQPTGLYYRISKKKLLKLTGQDWLTFLQSHDIQKEDLDSLNVPLSEPLDFDDLIGQIQNLPLQDLSKNRINRRILHWTTYLEQQYIDALRNPA